MSHLTGEQNTYTALGYFLRTPNKEKQISGIFRYVSHLTEDQNTCTVQRTSLVVEIRREGMTLWRNDHKGSG